MSDLHHVSIGLTLAFDGATHLGTGRAEGLLNRTVSRSANGQPYVPGSALKGALRMTAERITQQLNHCLHAPGLSPSERLGYQRRGDAILDTPCRGPRPEEMCQSETPCIVCRLFGNVFTGSRLHVDDAYPVSTAFQKSLQKLRERQNDGASAGRSRFGTVDVITRLSVDRRRKGAKSGALFTSEYSRPEMPFETRIEGSIPLHPLGEDGAPAELVLLAATLAATDQVGGEASTGHGRCTIKTETIKVDGTAPSYGVDALLAKEALEQLAWSRLI
ncbi:RAMP superfamily CRISPR-associated protein [Salisaeta longa]|uniref:RAMP superfamily CRISPR-associated protein n=1 Tax=Salisaeta longa TaxID=503170 RepID=UPI0003B32A68|nr:RAMP superfamily CRISPR-associated protein [Salisaeta longa]